MSEKWNAVQGLIPNLLKIADAADAAGFTKSADDIAALLPAARIMRAAQYEGFQNYWVANGRAFEKSYWQKRQKKKTSDDEPKTAEDYKSAHEAWFDTLEEYQKSLGGSQEEFLSKFAAKKGKEETEEASGTMSPGSVMSEAMTERYKKIKDKAQKDNKTEGEEISEWLADHREASRLLLKKVAQRISAGASPGVAFYEAMDEFVSGKWLEETKEGLRTAVANLQRAAAEAGKGDLLKQAGWAEDIQGFFPESAKE